MGASRRYPPNRRLTWARLQRGWSCEEVTRQIKASMEEQGDGEPGLIANTVRRWETGERWPEPRFRKHLVLIFGQQASDLGLLTPDELALRPTEDQPLQLIRRLLNVVWSDGGAQEFGRNAFLQGLLGAGLMPVVGPLGASIESLEPLVHAVGHSKDLDQRSVNSYCEITAKQRELYWSSPARKLFESALSHAQLGIHLMHSASTNELHTRLASSLSESALLSGRLAFFDLRQTAFAKHCFTVAQHAAEHANNHALAAAVFAHASFIPGFAGDRAAAQSLLDAAQGHARYSSGPAFRSWLYCVAAEITARTGDAKSSMNYVRQAHDSLATRGTDPEWLDFYGPSRLAGFTGYSQLIAGRPAEAATSLEHAINELDPAATKQRAVLLFDLATAYATTDPERAASKVTAAFDALEQGWYGTAFERIQAVRAALTGTPFLGELEDRARVLQEGVS